MCSLSTIRKLLVFAALAAAPLASRAQIFISVGFAPPALPVYSQPLCPGDGYLWTPGYWAYDDGGYYWVPGVWIQPPTIGYLWTPPYWGFNNGLYGFHEGYWGRHVGFYGGVNYGFGFFGSGYDGGRWEGDRFAYNRSVNNINIVNIHNTYEDRSGFRRDNDRTSFNGGPNGLHARPDSREANFDRERHVGPTAIQQSHFQDAHQIPANFARNNDGHPAVAAMPRPGATQEAVSARGFPGQRADNQQQRIANGVNSGQINAREAGHLENREANINQTIRQDRRANGGVLTPQERQNIDQRQNNTNRSIYQDDHNAATQPTVRGGFGGNQQQPQSQQQPGQQQIQQRDRAQQQQQIQQQQQQIQQRGRAQQQQIEQQQQTQQRAQQQQQQIQQQQRAQQQQQRAQPQQQVERPPQSQMQRPVQAQPRAEPPHQQAAPRPEGPRGGGGDGGREHNR